MGKKRVAEDFNDEDKPSNHVPIVHHHHHRHHNHQKPKKNKSESKLLHTLNSHLKKITKYRSKNLISLSSPPPTNISHENKKNHRGHLSCWLNNDQKDDFTDWFMDINFDHDTPPFEFGQEVFLKTTSFLGSEDNEDLFGGDFVFSPDLHASHNMVMVFEEYGFGSWSYIPDPNVSLGDNDKGRHIYDLLKLMSLEDMINEFLKVNLFVS